MRRTVCLECIAVCGLMQLLMTYLVVHMVMTPTSEVVHTDSRLLLSLADPTGPKLEVASGEDKSLEVVENLPVVSADQGLVDKWRRHKTHLFVATGQDWRPLSESRQVSHCFLRFAAFLSHLRGSLSFKLLLVIIG